ncbi:MAG: STAS domain-containing protein [Bacilli bacterium]|nr:STAS domain-containing protein [Bacilli bacterium]
MDIIKTFDGDTLTIALGGKLDSNSAPELEAELFKSLEGIKLLIWDFEKLYYLSSAGLRILLSTQKIMNKQGKMILRHVNEIIMETFDMTGFTSILTFED